MSAAIGLTSAKLAGAVHGTATAKATARRDGRALQIWGDSRVTFWYLDAGTLRRKTWARFERIAP